MYICVCFIQNHYNTSNAIQQGFVEPNIQQALLLKLGTCNENQINT